MSNLPDFDVIVVGSGFGGSLLTQIARRLDLRVLLVERGSHPRFAIGESTSPLANLVLEEICRECELPALLPLTSYGSWKETYPDVVCGLKRGFTFYHHQADRPFERNEDHSNELMVAASPSNRMSDMHWLRSDVDHFLVQQAIEAGVEYRDQAQIRSLSICNGRAEIEVRSPGGDWRASGTFLVDATGPRGFLHRHLGLGEDPWPHLNHTQALFSHFTDVPLPEIGGGEQPPYPPEWAAVHQVFEGGWIWSLRFDNGVTSVGAAAQPWLAEELELSSGERGWEKLLNRFPGLQRYQSARAIRRFDYSPCLPFRSARIWGEGWALLPSAAGFVDPFLSTGIPLTLLGIQRLGCIMKRAARAGQLDSDRIVESLEEYARSTALEMNATALLISGCYSSFGHFELLTPLLTYYFAAASFAEMSRRLRQQKPGIPASGLFLRADDVEYQQSIAFACQRVQEWSKPTSGKPAARDAEAFREHVRSGIERVNIAGLMNPARHNWYPVELQDVVDGAHLLKLTTAEARMFVNSLPI